MCVCVLRVALCCLVISNAIINVSLHLAQRVPDGAVALIVAVCMYLCLCVVVFTQHCYLSPSPEGCVALKLEL